MSFLALLSITILLSLSSIILAYLRQKPCLKHFPVLTPFATITELSYICFNARLRGNTTRSHALLEAHKRLGPVIVLGPNRISFSSPGAIRDIYGTTTKCIKGDQYTNAGGVPNVFTETNKQHHAAKRKLLSNAFASSNLLTWEQKIAKNIRSLLDRLDAQNGKIVDWRYLSNLFTLDAIFSIALSRDSGFLREGTDIVSIEQTDGSRKSVGMIACVRSNNSATEPVVWSADWFPILKWMTAWIPSYRHDWWLTEQWQLLVKQIYRQRMTLEDGGHELDDVFACLLRDNKGNALNLPSEEIVSETSILLDAGSDTTSTALTHLLYCLAKHPTQLARLRHELNTNLTDQSSIPAYFQVKSLPYLRACIDESLRLRPPLSAGAQRLTPPEGMNIDGDWIDGGINVSVAPYIVHRDERIYGRDVEEFRPERWIEGSEESRKVMQRNFFTFNSGARVCLGKNITYMEQTMLIAAIVQRYEFDLPSPDWQVEWDEYFNLWPRKMPFSFHIGGDKSPDALAP